MPRDPHATLSPLLPRLVAFARTMVGSPDAARDLVQEAVTRALSARQVPSDAPAYRAWMFRIVRNAAVDTIRRARVESTLTPPAPDADIWRYEDRHIAKLTVERGLDGLPPSHREIIALIDIAGFSYAEAADLLGIPQGTVMSRVARARAALLAAIESAPLRVLKSNHGS